MTSVSIIIRTKNEAAWLRHCLDMVFKQSFKDFEVVIVDNESSDNTLGIAKRYPITKFVHISKFMPGDAINKGVEASNGKYIVCLSAHCVPKRDDWLSNLVGCLEGEEGAAGVYGRQLPVSYTDPVDKRDLLITFGRDRRIQKRDYFFHNANSIIRREVWEKYPFDDKATNIEDRIWGKTVTEQGYVLVYEPSAEVYHYHGLHQGNPRKRVRGVVSIIERIDNDIVNDIPDGMKPQNIQVAAILPINDQRELSESKRHLLQKTMETIRNSKYIDDFYILSNRNYSPAEEQAWLDRKLIPNAEKLSIGELLSEGLNLLEAKGRFPALIFFINYDYLFRYTDLDELVYKRQYQGYETVFPGYEDYGHYWIIKDDTYEQVNKSLDPRENRSPAYTALYGQGCLTSAENIRHSKLVGGKIGIVPVGDFRYTLRYNRNSVRTIIDDQQVVSIINHDS